YVQGHREPAGPCEPGGVPGTKAHPKEPDCQDRRNWPGSAAEPRQTAGGGKRVVQPWSFRLVKRWPAPAYNHSAGRRGRSKSPRIKKEHDYLRLWTGDFTARRQHSVRHFGCAGTPHSRSEEHTSELQSRFDLVCRLLLEKKKKQY